MNGSILVVVVQAHSLRPGRRLDRSARRFGIGRASANAHAMSQAIRILEREGASDRRAATCFRSRVRSTRRRRPAPLVLFAERDAHTSCPSCGSRDAHTIGIPLFAFGQKMRPASSSASNASWVSRPATMSPTKRGMAQCRPLSVGSMPRHASPEGPVRTPAAVRSARLKELMSRCVETATCSPGHA